MYDYLIVGSGLYGSIFAREATDKGYKVLVIDKRENVGGNIYTEKVEGINFHKYGAHIFHTNIKEVWDYLNQYTTFNRFTNSPVANYKGELYSLPLQKDADGEYAYNFGVILNYLFRVSELEQIMSHKLPLHVVEKKIPYMDANGNHVKPEQPNGYKFEQLVLDMIHDMDSCLPFEVVREKEFAPIKNKEGVDSVETARELLKKNGITI